MKAQLRLLFLLAAAAAAAAPGRAQSDDDATTASVRFSAADQPGTLRIDVPWGDLKITGADVAEVTVRSSLNEKNKSKRTKDGLRRLDEEVSFELVEKNNVVTLSVAGDAGFGNQAAEFEITVPRRTSLELKTDMGGDIDVRAVEGDIGIEAMNGEVRLADIVSSASVSTMNGEINASFKAPPAKPVSLSSMNGEINVRLPAATKANLRMRTHNGSILTDFSEDALKTRAETKVRTSAEAPDAPAAKLLPEPPEPAEAPEAPEATATAAARSTRDATRDAARDVQREAQRLAREAQRLQREESDAAREMQAAAQELARNAVQIAAEVSREVNRAVATHRIRVPRAPRAPLFGGKAIVGTLNGGGVDISLTSMNGSITVRETK